MHGTLGLVSIPACFARTLRGGEVLRALAARRRGDPRRCLGLDLSRGATRMFQPVRPVPAPSMEFLDKLMNMSEDTLLDGDTFRLRSGVDLPLLPFGDQDVRAQSAVYSADRGELKVRLTMPPGGHNVDETVTLPLLDHSRRVNRELGEITGNVVGIEDGRYVVDGSMQFGDADDLIGEHLMYSGAASVESPAVNELWDEFASSEAPEGVSWSDDAVSDDLRSRLNRAINFLADAKPVFHHPGTNGVVRDLVHPSLYPFIRGVSRVSSTVLDEEGNAAPSAEEGDGSTLRPDEQPVGQHLGRLAIGGGAGGWGAQRDFWGREYENSIYQWLPAEFEVQENGSCFIRSYVNNLDRRQFGEVYGVLEELFERAVPHLEQVYAYIQGLRFYEEHEDFSAVGAHSDGYRYDPDRGRLRGSTVQVVAKIVDYELRADMSFDSIWHVEGMSHENIVATCVYVADRDERVHGGDILFKRAMWDFEAKHVYWEVPQDRHVEADRVFTNGLIPLGKVKTPKGRMVVFPNSHVHRLTEITGTGRRRIVAFFLVNPAVRILSTAHVPPQQTALSEDEALHHLEQLMQERKLHKQDWNVRDISLCEH